MDSSLYKSTTTSRGIRYNYYSSSGQQGKPTLLFCHGFPSTSSDWRFFVAFFKGKGYGVIVPDMLGYGDTDKPTDPSLYVSSLVSRDLVDILDAEGVDKVVAIGHDWGSKAVSRLATYFPDRFVAYAFLAESYVPLRAQVKFEDTLATIEKINGYDTYGYWLFFSSEEADTVIKGHINSFVNVLWPHDPAIWKTKFAPTGAFKSALLEDFRSPLPPYLTQESADSWKETFLKNGFVAPTCWYKVMTNKMESEDDQQVPPERALPPKTAPIFFGAAMKDYICVAAGRRAVLTSDGFKDHHVTIRDFDADHWLILSKAEEICRELEHWIEDTVIGEARE